MYSPDAMIDHEFMMPFVLLTVYIMILYTNILSSGDMHIFQRIFSRYMGNRTKREGKRGLGGPICKRYTLF